MAGCHGVILVALYKHSCNRNIMQIVLVLTQKCWFVIPFYSTLPAAGTRALTPLLAFTGTDSVTTTPFVTHSHPFN